MGFFSKLFGGGSNLESRLEEQYTALAQGAMGMSAHDARAHARGLLQVAKSKSREMPDNVGDSLLEREKVEPEVRELLASRRSEGVVDADIRWWWNLPDLERQMMLASDDNHRLAFFMDCLRKGMHEQAAAKAVRKTFPMYGDLADSTHGSGDNRPLPYELKDRVNLFIERHLMPDPEGAKVKIAAHETYNAFIREELRAGRV